MGHISATLMWNPDLPGKESEMLAARERGLIEEGESRSGSTASAKAVPLKERGEEEIGDISKQLPRHWLIMVQDVTLKYLNVTQVFKDNYRFETKSPSFLSLMIIILERTECRTGA